MFMEAVKRYKVEIFLKGKNMLIILPDKLKRKLRTFADERGIKTGVIFRTRTGKLVGRKRIWAQMKAATEAAGIEQGKYSPTHNLRHLFARVRVFARVYYKATKNLAKLTNLLGHSSMETIRIYILSTEESH